MEEKFKVGNVVLFNYNASNIFSKQIVKYNIREYGESKTTHSGIISKVDGDKITIFEIVKYKGAEHYIYDKNWLENKVKTKEIIIRKPKADLSNVYKICNNYLNIRYSILDIICIFIFGLTKLKISLTNMRSIICSELVCRVLFDASKKKINFEKEYNKSYDLITPMDIYYSKQLKNIK